MLVFNNQQRSGHEEVSSYGPQFYREIIEMDAIYRFAGYTLDLMAADLEKIAAYQYIENMNEEWVGRMEQFYGVVPFVDAALEVRKRYLITLLNSGGKLSASKLENDIKRIIGLENNVTVTMPQSMEIAIETLDDSDKTYQMISDYLDKVLPVHLAYNVIYDRPMNVCNYFSAIWQDDEIFILRQVIL